MQRENDENSQRQMRWRKNWKEIKMMSTQYLETYKKEPFQRVEKKPMKPGDKSWKTDENRWMHGYEYEINFLGELQVTHP